MIEKLRGPTKDLMRVEMAEWAKHPMLQMDTKNINVKLTIERRSSDPVTKYHYSDIFKDSKTFFQQMLVLICGNLNKVERGIFIKGRPGSGKSTLVKKIAWDWASEMFESFALVLFVPLKLLRSNDTFEDVIIRQNEILRDEISPEQLRSIFETFGNHCLLILDDLEEFGQHVDISNIIEGNILKKCNFIVTGSLATTQKYSNCFETVVTVDGFTQSDAEKYISKWSGNSRQKLEILNLKTHLLNEPIKIETCPMLLNFLCILENKVKISDCEVKLGEIYYELVRWRCAQARKYKNKEFDKKYFEGLLDRLGKVALQTLLLNTFLTNSYVIREVGEDAFDYKLLIRHEGCRPAGD